jgi:hypothetical protein
MADPAQYGKTARKSPTRRTRAGLVLSELEWGAG